MLHPSNSPQSKRKERGQMATSYVLTHRALEAVLPKVTPKGLADLDLSQLDGIASVETDDATFVIHRNDRPDVPRIVIFSEEDKIFSPAAPESHRSILQRIDSFVQRASQPPLRLPARWNAYHYKSLVTFFAGPPREPSLRWVAEIHPDQSQDYCFWRITGKHDPVSLETFVSPYGVYRRVVEGFEGAYTLAQEILNSSSVDVEPVVQGAIDLEATTFRAVTQDRTYSAWFERLTARQRDFVDAQVDQSIKLRGPAGTGKTLALELKALHELYDASERGEACRILFVTHSWSSAEHIDAGLEHLDERGLAQAIQVWPLLALPEYIMPEERSGHRFMLLGEDSYSGKKLQLDRIGRTLKHMMKGDWLTFRRTASDQLRDRIEAPEESSEWNALIWDLMIEFASVLFSNGILPGVNAEKRYLAIQRTPWMMPLDSTGDKKLVLAIFSEYVRGLREDGLLTSDQRINDFLNYLETFAWDFRRSEEGYDLIFVDELQLFTDQERLALHYLTRSADEYPRLVMASDPRQAPYEVYGLPIEGQTPTQIAEEGAERIIELSTIHRFTPEILALVKHIHFSYPALELGSEWDFDMNAVESAVDSGPVPKLIQHEDELTEASRVLTHVQRVFDNSPDEARVAVLLLDVLRLPLYRKEAAPFGGRFRVIGGREDVDLLRYSKRAITLAPAEYVGGLQFHTVIVAGVTNTGLGVSTQSYRLKQFLSLLYLAISRATNRVEIHVNSRDGGIPQILEQAIENHVLDA